MNGISVVICCYNSATRIEETLKYLKSQKNTESIPWEIIIVNNASTDNIKEIILSHTSEHKSLRLIDEPRAGLIHARLTGIQQTSFDLVLFCDDDNHLDENYINISYHLMQGHPEVIIAGTLIKPKLPFYPGKWIEANYSALAIGAVAEHSGFIDWVFGAGMIVRKKIYDELKSRGISLMLTGRLGAKQTSGDDAELCHLARFIGYKIYYSQDLILDHKISAHRLTRWNFIKANYKNVYMVVYFFILDKLIIDSGVKISRLRSDFLITRIKAVFYFSPRVFFGKNNFYSFIMLYQNIQLIAWFLIRKRKFDELYRMVRLNLYK